MLGALLAEGETEAADAVLARNVVGAEQAVVVLERGEGGFRGVRGGGRRRAVDSAEAGVGGGTELVFELGWSEGRRVGESDLPPGLADVDVGLVALRRYGKL